MSPGKFLDVTKQIRPIPDARTQERKKKKPPDGRIHGEFFEQLYPVKAWVQSRRGNRGHRMEKSGAVWLVCVTTYLGRIHLSWTWCRRQACQLVGKKPFRGFFFFLLYILHPCLIRMKPGSRLTMPFHVKQQKVSAMALLGKE